MGRGVFAHHRGFADIVNHGGAEVRQGVPVLSLQVSYHTPDVLGGRGVPDNLLGIVQYGSAPPVVTGGPRALVPVGGEAVCEVWQGQRAVAGSAQGVDYADDGEWLFATVDAPLPDTAGALEAVAEDSYRRLLALIQARHYPYLVRVWQYFPNINACDGELERYQAFNRGRYRALAPYLAGGGARPAATAIGCQGEGFHLYALARRDPGTAIENPRQISAFTYPRRYGPQAPDFVRAMRVDGTPHHLLFISGTAAIVGHASRHPGDVGAQVDEIVRNLDALVATAGLTAPVLQGVKAYIRPGVDPQAVVLPPRWQSATPLVRLPSAICRAELLVEIEAVLGG
ncbi:MAG: chorismate transformation enzyme, FkbO/Hyg5 family [Acidiferrobacter sp.]